MSTNGIINRIQETSDVREEERVAEQGSTFDEVTEKACLR